MVNVRVTLSDWLYQAVLARSVLTLNRDYFRLRKPLERRLYELVRKHCGQQRAWRVSLAVLLKKTGSNSPRRVFRAMLREIMRNDGLPDYRFEDDGDDMIVVTRKNTVIDEGRGLHLQPQTLEAARALVPGADVYALEAEWQAFASRRPPRDADAAFLGWLRRRT